MECNYDVTKIMSLRYYATMATSKAGATGHLQHKFVTLATLVLCCLYGGKQVGGSDNPDLASYSG